MVSHHYDTDAGLRQFPQDPAQFMLSSKIECERGLLENQRAWNVNESTREKLSPRFARRHFIGEAVGEVRNFKALHRTPGALSHVRSDFLVRPDPDTGKKSGEYDVASGNGSRTRCHQI